MSPLTFRIEADLTRARAGGLVTAACALLASLAVTVAWAQSTQQAPATDLETSALINQQLDAPIESLSVVNRPLPEVLRAIEERSGVPIYVTDETFGLLPYGRETPINVNVRNAPLRKTLTEIASRLGLEHVLRKENVELRPLPALERMGRRASVQELAGLDLLRQVPLGLEEDRPTAARLLEAIDLKLQEQDERAAQKNEPPPGFQVENRLDELLREHPVFVPRHATLLSALEALEEQTSATWFPWGDSFIVMSKADWVRRRLEAPVSLSYNQVEISEALLELQEASRVPFTIEPGALSRVPRDAQRVRLYLSNRSVRDALESLGGVTGLGYSLSDRGVYIYYAGDGQRPPANPHPGGAPGGEQPVVLVDLGEGMSLLLYPSDLPPELRTRLEARRQEAIEQLRRAAQSPPATQPSDEPAN